MAFGDFEDSMGFVRKKEVENIVVGKPAAQESYLLSNSHSWLLA